MNYKKYKKSISIFLILLVFALLYIYNANIKEIINIILVSFMIAYTIKPLRNYLCEKLKISKGKSTIAVILLVILIIVMCSVVLVPTLIDEVNNVDNIINEITMIVEKINEKINVDNIPLFSSLYNKINEKSNAMMTEAVEKLILKIISFSNNIISYAICPIIIYYFLSDGSLIYNNLIKIIPIKKRLKALKIINDIDKKLSSYILSQLLLCLIIGVLTFGLFVALKLKFSIWIAILNAIFNIIPYFGPVLGIIPAAVVGIIDSPIKCIYVIIGMIVIQQIEGNILSPKITGESTDIHPFMIIILLLVGEKVAGFVGMIIIIPIAVIVKVLYEDISTYIF